MVALLTDQNDQMHEHINLALPLFEAVIQSVKQAHVW